MNVGEIHERDAPEVAADIDRRLGRVPDRETFWLIERKVSPPQYITEGNDLSGDAWRARRWTTERAAHDHWRTMSSWRDECRVVVHLFINKQ